MNGENTVQRKMNIGKILRYIWWNYVKRFKFLIPLANKIVNTKIYQKFRVYVDGKYDIYNKKEGMEQARLYFDKNKERIENIKSRLSDAKSRLVYDNMIHYRCTHDSKYLDGIVDENQYFDKDLIKFGNKEVFVDCGAFNGDTIRSFLKNLRGGLGKLKEIVALEPDPYSYKKLTDWVSGFSTDAAKRIKCYNMGTWDEKSSLTFKGGAAGASVILDARRSVLSGDKIGNVSVDVDTLDDILKEKPVTFIKMDIEGSELPSLKGAEKVISNNLPRLTICIYHSDEDMLEIPEYLMEKYPEYSLYVRQHAFGDFETVLYAIPDKYSQR